MVGDAHGLVAGVQGLHVRVERVGVLHQELLDPQQAEAGPDLVPELRVDLVEGQGQLLVGLHGRPRVGGHDFLGGGRQAVGRLLAVRAREHRPAGDVVVPAAALLPQALLLEDRELDFERTGATELIPDDRLDLSQGLPEQRAVGVEA